MGAWVGLARVVQGACTCSGLILDADGTILTNAHTILACQRAQAQLRGGSRGATDEVTVHVALQDGRVFEGRVVCTDRFAPFAPFSAVWSAACQVSEGLTPGLVWAASLTVCFDQAGVLCPLRAGSLAAVKQEGCHPVLASALF